MWFFAMGCNPTAIPGPVQPGKIKLAEVPACAQIARRLLDQVADVAQICPADAIVPVSCAGMATVLPRRDSSNLLTI